MDFSELVQELKDRGFSDLTTARAGTIVNAARAELDRLHLWPYRQTDLTGTAPLSIADLGPIETVTSETGDYRLVPAQFRDLLDYYGDLSTTGSPTCYYTASVLGVPVVATYPTGTDTIGIVYYKVTVDISGTQEPASPDEFHELILEMAVRRVAKDPERRALAQQEIDRLLASLLVQYPPGVSDGEGMIISGWQSVDW